MKMGVTFIQSILLHPIATTVSHNHCNYTCYNHHGRKQSLMVQGFCLGLWTDVRSDTINLKCPGLWDEVQYFIIVKIKENWNLSLKIVGHTCDFDFTSHST
jgi:hypothetical protein